MDRNSHASHGPLLQMGRALFSPISAGEPQNGCAGTYSANHAGVTFFDAQGAPHVHVVNAQLGEAFPVSCWRDTRGRTHYMHSLASIHVSQFGLPEGCSDQQMWAQRVMDQVASAPWMQPPIVPHHASAGQPR